MADEDIIYGLHAVLAALSREKTEVTKRWVDGKRKDERITHVLHAAQANSVKVETVTQRELDKLAPSARHQGIVAQAKVLSAYTEYDLELLLANLTEPAFLLVLDGVQDPHNLGACLRSADAAGVHAVIAPQDRAVSLTHVVRKVASGAAEAVPFVQVTNLARTLKMLQQEGIWLIGAAGEAETSLYQADLQGPLALLLGGEGDGLRRLTRERCDVLVHIPMAGTVESLNVSVATGVCLFEAMRQRRQGKPL